MPAAQIKQPGVSAHNEKRRTTEPSRISTFAGWEEKMKPENETGKLIPLIGTVMRESAV